MSCYTEEPLINLSLGLIAITCYSKKKGGVQIGSLNQVQRKD